MSFPSAAAVESYRTSFDPALSTRTNVLIQLRLMAPKPPYYRQNQEYDHPRADILLLALINDPEITAAFVAIDKWYE